MLHRPIALTIAALVTGALVFPAQPAGAAGELCQGRPATIVGTGGVTAGTPGDDVIVTGTSHTVEAGAGNDVVCVTSPGPSQISVDAGPGDDVVDASTSTAGSTYTELGAGLDRYLGGPKYDEVSADGADDDLSGADLSVLDVTEPVATVIGSYAGSAIYVRSETLAVEISLGVARILVEGKQAADIHGFERASAVAPRAVVRGDGGDNKLSAWGCEVLMVGYGGDDVMLAGHVSESDPVLECGLEATLRGGPGNDYVKGLLGPNKLFGGGGRDELIGRTEIDRVLGGGGHDVLTGGADADVLRGNGGNDTLVGNPGADTLLGNRGRDTADGDDGRDRCVAEQESKCER